MKTSIQVRAEMWRGHSWLNAVHGPDYPWVWFWYLRIVKRQNSLRIVKYHWA